MKLEIKCSNVAKLLGFHPYVFQSMLWMLWGFAVGSRPSFRIRGTVTWKLDRLILCCPTKLNLG